MLEEEKKYASRICRSLVKYNHLRTQEAGGYRKTAWLFRIDVSRSPAAAAPVENTPGRNGDWASRQMLDSFPFVFAWKPVKVKLQADCWLRLELITMKRNTISCEKTWKARKYRKMVYSLLSFLRRRKASYGLETTV